MNVKIIGLGDHEGVNNVGGRIGTEKGPESFKTFYNKLNGDDFFQQTKEKIECLDFDNLSLEEKHNKASKSVAKAEKINDLTIVVGGGHDFIYSHVKGVSINHKKRTSCINIDPHLDMRPYDEKFTSGSPFRRLLDEKILSSDQLIEFGIQKHANAPALFEYAKSKHIDIVYYHELTFVNYLSVFHQKLTDLTQTSDHIVISLDLDVLQASYAPGVSAPAVEGFTPEQMKALLECAASFKEVKSLGIFELNPDLDIDDRTARLAAYCAYYFIDAKR